MPLGLPAFPRRGSANPFRKRFRPVETGILLLLFVAASVAIMVSAAILYTLADGTIAFFGSGDVTPAEFLTGEEWTPSGGNPSFGVLPLLAADNLRLCSGVA